MNLEDLKSPDAKTALRIVEADTLVELGFSRERADRMIQQLYDLIDGPWTDLLAPMLNPERSDEKAVFVSFWVSFLHEWASERLLWASVCQMRLLPKLAREDSESKPTR